MHEANARPVRRAGVGRRRGLARRRPRRALGAPATPTANAVTLSCVRPRSDRGQTTRAVLRGRRTTTSPTCALELPDGFLRRRARRRCARFRAARWSRTASWPRSPAARAQPAPPGRSAPATTCRRSCRRTASSRRAGSARYGELGVEYKRRLLALEGVVALSLSEELRDELAAIAPTRRCCTLAELSALFHASGAWHLRGRRASRSHLDLASPAAARRAFALLRDLGVRSEIRTYPRRAFDARDALPAACRGRRAARARCCVEAGVLSPAGAPLERPPKRVVGRSCCRGAYLRGALLGGGSLSGPRDPHLELRARRRAGARASSPRSPPARSVDAEGRRAAHARARLREGSRDDRRRARARRRGRDRAPPRRARGRGRHARAGEPARERRRGEPRADARPRRTRQLEAIRALDVDALPAHLAEIAELRLRHPTASLRELAAKMQAAAHERRQRTGAGRDRPARRLRLIPICNCSSGASRCHPHTQSTAGPRSSGGGFRPRPSPAFGAWFNRRGRSSSELSLRPARLRSDLALDRRTPSAGFALSSRYGSSAVSRRDVRRSAGAARRDQRPRQGRRAPRLGPAGDDAAAAARRSAPSSSRRSAASRTSSFTSPEIGRLLDELARLGRAARVRLVRGEPDPGRRAATGRRRASVPSELRAEMSRVGGARASRSGSTRARRNDFASVPARAAQEPRAAQALHRVLRRRPTSRTTSCSTTTSAG